MAIASWSDLASDPTRFLELVRRGESVVLQEGGETVARLEPPNGNEGDDEEEDEVSLVRGVFAPEFPGKPIPGFRMPSEPIKLERRPEVPNLSWSPPVDDDDE